MTKSSTKIIYKSYNCSWYTFSYNFFVSGTMVSNDIANISGLNSGPWPLFVEFLWYLNLCVYEGCLLYFRIRETNKYNLWKSLCCSSKYSPLRSIHFCMHLNQLSKHFCHTDWLIFLSAWQIFLKVKCSCNIECLLVTLMPMVVSISR